MHTALRFLISLACCWPVPVTVSVAQTAEEEPAAAAETKQPAPRLSRLQGQASLSRNRYVVGATVLVRPADESSRIFVTATDSKGRFRIDQLPDGTYDVELRREGLESVIKRNVGLRFPARAVIEVTMKPVAEPAAPTPAPAPDNERLDALELVTVSGRVVHGGEPKSDVQLRFVRRDGRVDPFTARSSSDGSFGPKQVPAGPWRLEASLVGFLPIWISVDLARDSELTVSMVPQPATYRPSPLELMPQEQPILPEHRRAEINPASD